MIFRLLGKEKERMGLVTPGGFSNTELADFLGIARVAKDIQSANAALKKASGLLADPTPPVLLTRNLNFIASRLGLNPCERAVLGFLMLARVAAPLRVTLALPGFNLPEPFETTLARALRISKTRIARAMAPESTLMRSGFLIAQDTLPLGRPDLRFAGTHGDAFIADLLFSPLDKRNPIAPLPFLASPAAEASIPLDAYPADRESIAFLVELLGKARQRKRDGIHILLHSPDHSTNAARAPQHLHTFAATLGSSLGMPVLEPRNKRPDQSRLSSSTRSNHLQATSRFHPDALLLIDAIEDFLTPHCWFFKEPSDLRADKFLPTLEKTAGPVLWLARDIPTLPAKLVAHFDFVMEVPPPKSTDIINQHPVLAGLPGNLLARYLANQNLPPQKLTRTCRTIEALFPKTSYKRHTQAVTRMLNHSERALARIHNAHAIPHITNDSTAANLDFIATEDDLPSLFKALRDQPCARICLHGPPGSGKSTFARKLAAELALPLHSCCASDLLDCYIGGTEKNLAAAFATASRIGGILLLDEADSFFHDRSRATRSWEITKVNELLMQMERFEGIFIAATNDFKSFDPASLRRFDLKIHLTFLQPDQCAALLNAHCKALALNSPSPSDITAAKSIPNATPGDFANVARQHRLRQFANPTTFIKSVAQECSLKPNCQLRHIGFA